jgi:hypothetical protein
VIGNDVAGHWLNNVSKVFADVVGIRHRANPLEEVPNRHCLEHLFTSHLCSLDAALLPNEPRHEANTLSAPPPPGKHFQQAGI